MASIEKPSEIIDANPEMGEWSGGVPFEEIWVAEGQLNVKFPESYKQFLQRYGSGSFAGEDIYGLGVPETNLPNVVFATDTLRTSDDFFPVDLVVIQDTGEGDLLCLATSRMDEAGECPVVQWIPEMSFEEQMFEVINRTFAHFLLAVARRATGG